MAKKIDMGESKVRMGRCSCPPCLGSTCWSLCLRTRHHPSVVIPKTELRKGSIAAAVGPDLSPIASLSYLVGWCNVCGERLSHS